MKWKKARKKSVEIEFREVEPKILIRIKHEETDLAGEHVHITEKIWGEIIHTLEGDHEAHVGIDYIIRGVRGKYYPIKKDIFYETYDVVEG